MEFLRILFFAKVVLLTPVPIDLFGDVELKPRKQLTAITTGASIEIDVSSMITKPQQEGIIEFRRRVAEMFPAGTIEVKLFGKDKREVVLRYGEGAAFSNDAVFLVLYADDGVPPDVEFERVLLTSRIKLKAVKVAWKNYKH